MYSYRITKEAQKHRSTGAHETHTHTHWRMAAIRWGNQACEDRGALRGCKHCMERVCAPLVCACVHLEGFYPSNGPSICLNINTVLCVTGQWLCWGSVGCTVFAINSQIWKRSEVQLYNFTKIIAHGTKAGKEMLQCLAADTIVHKKVSNYTGRKKERNVCNICLALVPWQPTNQPSWSATDTETLSFLTSSVLFPLEE